MNITLIISTAHSLRKPVVGSDNRGYDDRYERRRHDRYHEHGRDRREFENITTVSGATAGMSGATLATMTAGTRTMTWSLATMTAGTATATMSMTQRDVIRVSAPSAFYGFTVK